jgi:hypothetical protein
MKIVFGSLLMVLLAGMAGCNSAKSATPAGEEARVEPWRVILESSGGFAGRGLGGADFSSDGKASVSRMNGATEVTLSQAELEQLSDAVRKALPGNWKSPAVPRQGADMIMWSMKLESGSQKREVSWREDTSGELDAPVRALVDLMFALRGEKLGDH